MTKRILTVLAASLASAGILYAAGAFTAATFDITQWPVEGRAMVAIYWLIASVAAGVAVFRA